MSLVRLLFLLLGLTQVRGCIAPICDAVRGSWEPQAIVTRTGEQRMHAAAKPAGGDLLIETATSYMPPEYHHTLVRIDSAYGPQEVAKFKLVHWWGSAVVASGDTWWYSLGGMRAPKDGGVFFVTPERELFVPTPDVFAAEWLPLEGPNPGGLLLGNRINGRVAMEVTPGGIARSWPMPQHNAFSKGFWSAERVGGAIALVLYQPTSGLELFLFEGDETQVVQLRYGVDVTRIATAMAGESLAIVIETRDGLLESTIIDPHEPGVPHWRSLNSKEDPGRFPTLIRYRDELVVAWKSDKEKELRARTFTAERAGPSGVIATMKLRENSFTTIALVPDGEELLFLWPEDDTMVRRVPKEFAGLWFAEQLCRWLFSGTSVAL